MKRLLLLILFQAVYIVCEANAFDTIKTKPGLVRFLQLHCDSNMWWFQDFYETCVMDCPSKRKFGTNQFYKADVDGNGLTDIIIDGNHSYAIFDLGNKCKVCRLYWHNFGPDSNNHSFSRVVMKKGQQTLLLFNRYIDVYTETPYAVDTLIYKYGIIAEYNSTNITSSIDAVLFSESWNGGYYRLEITKSAVVMTTTTDYGGISEKFRSQISRQIFERIVSLLNYVAKNSLQNNYSLKDATDVSSATLEIIYSDGRTRKMEDFGMLGTIGLMGIYQTMFDLKETQSWEKLN